MALLRKLLYKKPPDGLIGIFERIYVFDCCFTTEAWEQEDYKVYVGNIISQFKDSYPESSIMIFNFREGDTTSRIDAALQGYDLTLIDYPRHYEGCPLLPIEVIHHFLKSSESWLSVGQQNILLMHSEIGGWVVVAFLLAALLLYRSNFTGENKTLDMVHKQAPRDLLPVLSPMNPIPSQLRYLQYVSKRNAGTEWPPEDKALTLDCVIIRMIPDFDEKGGCCPVFRIYGRDPLLHVDKTPKLLFSTPRRNKNVRYYNQADCELVKIDINCHIQGDVVMECISLHEDMGREKMMYRAMFSTAFMKSNMLMLNRDEIDIHWDAKDHFPKDFKTELLFSEMDASASMVPVDLSCFEEEGLPMEAFAKVQEMFGIVDWLIPKSDAALTALYQMALSDIVNEMEIFHQRTEASNLLQTLTPKKDLDKRSITLSDGKSKSFSYLGTEKPSTDAGGDKAEGPRSDSDVPTQLSSPPHIILTCAHPSVSEKLETLHEGAKSSLAAPLPANQSSSSCPPTPAPSQQTKDVKDGPPPPPAPQPNTGSAAPPPPAVPSTSSREDQTVRNETTSAAPGAPAAAAPSAASAAAPAPAAPPAPAPPAPPPAPPSSRPAPPPPPSGASSAPPPPPSGASSAPPPPTSGASSSAPPPPPGPSANGNVKGGAAPPPPPSLQRGPSMSAPSPPPPITKGRVLSRTTAVKSQPTKKLKPLHWLKLNRAAQGSLWAEAQKSGEAARAPEIDMSELEHLFSATNPNSDKAAKSKSSAVAKPEKVHLIEHRRAYNCEIMLSKVKIPFHELMDIVLALDDSSMDVDQVDNLIKFCPIKEEMEQLKAYKGEKDKLGKCELFFMELMRVPRTEAKLRVFSFKLQFSTQASDLRKSLNNVYSAGEQIRSSVKLRRVMQTILSLGNALNQGTARGAAVGFRLDSLLKLTETRARNNKMTLMHYLCKVIADKLPELLDFSKELSSLEPASKIQLKILAEEMQAITKGLEKVVQELKMSKKDGHVSKRFRKCLKKFLSSAEGEAKSLATLYSGVGKSVDALILYFGEDPARCPYEQVVNTLLIFVRMFNNAHMENCKQIEAEKKKAEKEAKEAANEKLKPKNHSNMESELIRNSPIKSAE